MSDQQSFRVFYPRGKRSGWPIVVFEADNGEYFGISRSGKVERVSATNIGEIEEIPLSVLSAEQISSFCALEERETYSSCENRVQKFANRCLREHFEKKEYRLLAQILFEVSERMSALNCFEIRYLTYAARQADMGWFEVNDRIARLKQAMDTCIRKGVTPEILIESVQEIRTNFESRTA